MTNTGWLSAYQARRLVADRREAWGKDALDTVEWSIVDYARTLLPVRCGYMWDKVIFDSQAEEKHESRDCDVPTWVWDLTQDCKLDWAAGVFHLAGDRDGNLRYVKLAGVEFDAAAMDRLWPTVEPDVPRTTSVPPSAAQSTRGRKRKGEWNDWVAYLVLHYHEAGIGPNDGPDTLMSAVAERMAKDGLHEMPRATVQPAAARVIEVFRQQQ